MFIRLFFLLPFTFLRIGFVAGQPAEKTKWLGKPIMKYSFFVPLASLFLAVSCNTSDAETADDLAINTPGGAIKASEDTVPPVQAKQGGGVVPAPANTAPAAAAGITVNPPHGQPGHRCDISVGAPLPQAGTPAAAAVPQVQPQQPVTVVAPANTAPIAPVSAAPVVVGKGKNPPHGQPGHRCDIAVGAPLD